MSGHIFYIHFSSILHTAIVSSLCNEDVTPSNNTLSSTSNHTESYPGDGFSTVEISAKSHQSNHSDEQKVRLNLLILSLINFMALPVHKVWEEFLNHHDLA